MIRSEEQKLSGTVGILTFHSQQNYGGVLQAWALQEALAAEGFDVTVVDRWLDRTNEVLYRGSPSSLREWLRHLMRCACALGDFAPVLRSLRTRRFLSRRLKRTAWHFTDWQRLPPETRLPETVVVGSDQVWHAGRWGDPRPYLLWQAPPVRAIAYAASFGMTRANVKDLEQATALGAWDKSIPLGPGETLGRIYREGLARFSAISCREAEGVEICRDLGAEAVHVVDPTLLVDPTLFASRRRAPSRPVYACYVLGVNWRSAVAKFEGFARENGVRVDVFLDGYPAEWYGPFPKSPATLKAWWRAFRLRWKLTHSRVRVRVSAGPEEFLRTVEGAAGVVTDSFHALMFSIVFGRNVRVLRPENDLRRQMFARIEEFAAHAEGPMIAENLDAALDSLAKGERVSFDRKWLDARRAYSRQWLLDALKGR